MTDLSHPPFNPVLTLRINTHQDEYEQLPLPLVSLKAFPQYDLDDVTVTCLSGAEKGRIKRYRGALLRDVINSIGLEAADRRMLKGMLIIARAHDNYSAIFSWNEIFNTAVGDSVLVLYERNGERLGDLNGDLALISANDIRNGPRHIRGLREIELRRLPES